MYSQKCVHIVSSLSQMPKIGSGMISNSCMMNSKLPLFLASLLALWPAGGAHSPQRQQLGTTFWVAPHIGRCQGLNETTFEPCNTLAGYQQNESIFSTSHSTWIFLKGEHAMADAPILVENASEITWMGQPECWGEVHICSIILPPNVGKNFRVPVYIRQSSAITLKALAFHDAANRRSHLHNSSAFTLTEVTDFHLINVTYNFSGNWYAVLRIKSPSGHYLIKGCQRNGHGHVKFDMYTLIDDTVSKSYRAADHNFTLDVRSSSFLGEVGLAMWGNVAAFMTDVNVTCTNSFFRSVQVAVDEYPASEFCVHFDNCIFRGEGIPGSSLIMWLSIVPQTFSQAHYRRMQPWCTITNSAIIGALDVTWTYNFSSKQIATNCQAVLPTVQVHNTSITVTDRTSSFKTCAVCARLQPSAFPQHCFFSHPVFSITDSVIRAVSKTIRAIVVFQNFYSLRVSFSGGVQINGGTGLYLMNSHLEIHGYCEIIADSDYSAILSSDSTLLLANNSFLNMSNNHLCSLNEQFLLRLSKSQGAISIEIRDSYDSFIDCYVDKTTCPGHCFFQFIDEESGHYIQNGEQFTYFNSTIDILCNNTDPDATLPWRIVNGHLFGCSLQTRKKTVTVTGDLLAHVFNTSMDNVKQQSYSPLYSICLCNTPLSPDFSQCQRNVSFELYPVSRFPLSLVVVRDFLQPTKAIMNLVITPMTMNNYHTKHFNHIKATTTRCTTVPTLQFDDGIVQYQVHFSATPVTEDPYFMKGEVKLNKVLHIKLANRCPPGMRLNSLAIEGSISLCSCNPHMSDHRLTCTTDGINAQYQISKSHYWIGITKGRLLFSDYCPAFYCNSNSSRSIVLKDLNSSLRCNAHNSRQGLLCSECPLGYSSVFGSFQCKKCSTVWLLQLPLYAVGGIFIVALLFLFNLTLLQGTIMGVVLYTNIMALMADFLQEYAWSPLFFLLSVLNLQSGAGVCFFDGMDEFWKALLQFVFPLYLFTLLIVIIIVTHKCGYRMFRKARFIARRAVPVLATIMLLTYTSLVDAAIAPLRYTIVYNADTTQGESVWLYQPSLPFFNGQHLVLGILSLAVTLLYLIPFTFTMLFGDLMRRYFHKLWFSHFMDVLHGAFRWPLGFWIGLRLLVRVILVVISICTNPNTSAFCTLAAAGTLLVAQLLIGPFRDPNPFREDMHLQGPPSCKRKCLMWIKKFLNTYHTPLFDTLFLFNIALTSAMVSFGTNPQTKKLSVAGSNILILMALAQFAVILVYHAYNFFPIPEKARSFAQSCWSTMRSVPSMLKDTQCCRRGYREEEEPRRSPTPILILRPPEIDESYDSESEMSSYNEQSPPGEVEVKESTLQVPLLTHGN